MKRVNLEQRQVLGIVLVTTLLSLMAGYYLYPIFGVNVGDVSTFYMDRGTRYEASYVVGVWNSTHYYGMNGTTGQREYLSNNFTYIVQTYIDNTNTRGGGCVLIKAGEYNPTQCIIPKSNVHLRGESQEATLIKVADGTPDGWGSLHSIIRYYDVGGATAYNMTVSDMTLDTNPLGLSYGMTTLGFQSPTENCRIENIKVLGFDGTNQAGISINTGLNDVIANCYITEGGIEGSTTCEAIYITNTNYSMISGNIIRNMSREGMYIGENAHNNIIEGNIVEDCDDSGIEIKATSTQTTISNNILYNNVNNIFIGGKRNTVTGNTIENGTNGVVIKGQGGTVAGNNTVIGNIIYNMGTVGISFDGSSTGTTHNVATGNTIANGGYGVLVYAANYSVVSNNLITGTNYGVEMQDYSFYTVVSDNVITSAVRGIWEDTAVPGSDYNVITGCIVTGATYNILVNGTNTKCNLCYNGTVWIP